MAGLEAICKSMCFLFPSVRHEMSTLAAHQALESREQDKLIASMLEQKLLCGTGASLVSGHDMRLWHHLFCELSKLVNLM